MGCCLHLKVMVPDPPTPTPGGQFRDANQAAEGRLLLWDVMAANFKAPPRQRGLDPPASPVPSSFNQAVG